MDFDVLYGAKLGWEMATQCVPKGLQKTSEKWWGGSPARSGYGSPLLIIREYQREIFPLALPYVGKSVQRPSLEHPRPHIKKLFENPSKSVCQYRLKNNVLQDRFGDAIFVRKKRKRARDLGRFWERGTFKLFGGSFFLKMDAETRSNGSDVHTKSKNEANTGRHLGIDFWRILVEFGKQVGKANGSKNDTRDLFKSEAKLASIFNRFRLIRGPKIN